MNCPKCSSVMNKVGLAAGIEIDCCDAHGAWLDVGELQAIVSYAERSTTPVHRSAPSSQGPSVLEGMGRQLVSSAVSGAGFGVGSSLASTLVRKIFG